MNSNQSTTESYSYDAVGNRLSSLNVASYSYNSSNELTSSADGYSYTYDANGNTLTKANSSGTTSYAWDFENRLTSVTLPNGGGTVSFRYDPFGNRVQKSGPNGTTSYVYDGVNTLEELDSSGAVVSRYTHTIGVDEPLAEVRSGTTNFYEADGLGSITSISNAAASLAQTYTFNAFGNLGASSGSLTNPLQYTGRDFDSETWLSYHRAHYYDSGQERFLNEDPLQFNAGMNFYEYSYNNPANFKDPSGLQPAPAYIPPPPAAGGGLTLIQEGGGAAGGASAGVMAATAGLIVLDVGLAVYDGVQVYHLGQAYGWWGNPKPSTKPDNAARRSCKVGNGPDDEDPCEEMYREDTALCTKLGSRACHEQAAQRYAACLAGRPIPPFPWRTPFRVK